MQIISRNTIAITVALLLALGAAGTAFAQTPVFCAPPTATPKDPPPDDDPPPCGDEECGTCTASPCFAKTGVYTTGATDLQMRTNGLPLEVSRSYESWHAVDNAAGFGWTSNLSARLYYATYLVSAPSVFRHEAVVLMPSGEAYRYEQNTDGTFRAPLGRRDTLVRAGDGTFTLTLQSSNVRYGFAADGALLTMKDDHGNTLRFTLDALRRVERVDDDSGTGRSLAVTWNPAGRLGSVQDHSGRVVSYSYNTDGTLASVTNPAGHITTYSYEQRRFGPLLKQVKDHWGRVITDVTWDSLDRVRTYTDKGETYTMTYQPTLTQPRTLKAHSTGTQTISYDSAGLVTSRGSGTTSFTPEGEALVVTDARNRKTRYTYTTGGRLLTKTVNEGFTTGVGDVTFHYAYHPVFTNKVTSIEPHLANWSGTAFNGHWLGWKYTYYDITDPTTGQLAGALKQVDRVAYQHQTNTVLTENCGTCTYLSFRYDAKGRVTRDFNRFEGQTSYVHDDTLNQVTVHHPSNGTGTRTTIYKFDSIGRVASVTDPMNNVTSYEYDALDRIKKITLPPPSAGSALNFTTTYLYDQTGSNPGLIYTHATDANQRVYKQGYDQFGQLVESIDAANNKTTYTYTNGLLASVTDANGNVTSYEYDTMRHLKKTTFPDGRSESYTHYTDGLLASRTDRAGVTTTYNYDAFGRMVSETTGSQSRSYTYEGAKLMSILDNYSGVQETTSFTYDPKTFLPLTDEQGRRYNPATGTSTTRGKITYTWELSMDRMATYTVADGDSNRRPPITAYSYNNDGTVSEMEWEHVPTGQFTFTYDKNGNVTKITYPNGQERSYTLDNHGRVLTVSNHLGGTSLASFTYEYDKNQDTNQYDQLGLRTKVTARVPAWQYDLVTSRYSYDADRQLVKERVTTGSTTTETSWGYDGIGNRISRTAFGSTANYNYVKNAAGGNTGQLASFGGSTATHDANGNMTAFGITAAWDARGRMSKLQNTFNFQYDAYDRRSTVDYLTQKYIYQGPNAVAVSYKQNNGYYLADYVFAPGIDEPLARGDYFGVTYYSADALGSVILLSDPDGTVRNHYRYDAWGQMVEEGGPIVQPFAYTGRELAVLNYGQRGVYYYRARWMLPGHGRFMSEDPYRNGGVTPYAYVSNQPLQYIDPSGAVAVNKNKSHHSEDHDTVVQHCGGANVKGCALFKMTTNCSCSAACDIKTKKVVYKANISINAKFDVHISNNHWKNSEAEIHKHEYDHVTAYEKIVDYAAKQGKGVEAQSYPSMAVCKIGCFGFNANWNNYGFLIGLGETLDDWF